MALLLFIKTLLTHQNNYFMAKAIGKAAAPKKAAAKKTGVPPKKAAVKKAVAPPKKSTPPKKGSPAKKAAPKKGEAFKAAPQKIAAKKASMKTAPAPQPKKVFLSDENMLQVLFLDSIRDIYYAEKSALKALPRMSKAATSQELLAAFEKHGQQTNGQIQRLEQVFEILGKRAQGKKCEAIEGLIREADSLIKDTKKGSETRDVALIMAAQKIEHYEIASYGSIATLAAQMGQIEVKNLLGQTLQEEKDTDLLLTKIAESGINSQAEQEGSESEVNPGQNKEKEEELDPKAGDDGNTKE